MNILVTGANGFVGRAMVDHLARQGREVVAVRGPSARAPERVQGALVRYETVDLTGGPPLSTLFGDTQAVVHLAGRAHIRAGGVDDKRSTYDPLNIEGAVRLARAAAASNVGRFIYVSTIGVNGDETKGGPFTENDEPRPHNLYSQSKLEGEVAVSAVGRETGLPIVIVRPTLVVGPQAKANLLTIMKLVDRQIPLPLGMVNNRRSYAGLGNLVSFLDLCARHPKAAGETFLFADDPSISTPDLVRELARLLGRSPRLAPVPPRLLAFGTRMIGYEKAFSGLWKSLEVSMEKPRRLLDWRQPMSFEETLAAAASAFVSDRDAA